MVGFVPQSVNLFMNVGGFADRRVASGDNHAQSGDCVVFEAWIDTIVALFACPQESYPVPGGYPTDLHIGMDEAA